MPGVVTHVSRAALRAVGTLGLVVDEENLDTGVWVSAPNCDMHIDL